MPAKFYPLAFTTISLITRMYSFTPVSCVLCTSQYETSTMMLKRGAVQDREGSTLHRQEGLIRATKSILGHYVSQLFGLKIIVISFSSLYCLTCGRSLAGIANSNPAGGMDICLLCVAR